MDTEQEGIREDSFWDFFTKFDFTSPTDIVKTFAFAALGGLFGFAIGLKIHEDRKDKQA